MAVSLGLGPLLVAFLDLGPWMVASLDLHGFKFESSFPLSRFHQGCRVTHGVTAVGSHVPGEDGHDGDDSDGDGDGDDNSTNLVIMSLLHAE